MHRTLVIDVGFREHQNLHSLVKNFHVPLDITSITGIQVIAYVLWTKQKKNTNATQEYSQLKV